MSHCIHWQENEMKFVYVWYRKVNIGKWIKHFALTRADQNKSRYLEFHRIWSNKNILPSWATLNDNPRGVTSTLIIYIFVQYLIGNGWKSNFTIELASATAHIRTSSEQQFRSRSTCAGWLAYECIRARRRTEGKSDCIEIVLWSKRRRRTGTNDVCASENVNLRRNGVSVTNTKNKM